MSVGPSGRVVIEIDPGLKRGLYTALAKEGLTLKEWFVNNATTFVAQADQMSLNFQGASGGDDRETR